MANSNKKITQVFSLFLLSFLCAGLVSMTAMILRAVEIRLAFNEIQKAQQNGEL